MKIRKVKKFIPLAVSLGTFVSLFVFFNIKTSPPEIESQLSPRHSAYFTEFGKPLAYSTDYISQKGDLFNVRINDAPGTSEPRIIASPISAETFAVVANDFSAQGYGSVFTTGDGGMNWTHSKIPLTVIAANDMYYSDPWADYGADGSLAYVTVAMRSSEYTRNVVFNISRDNGNTWLDYPLTIKTFESKDVVFDKPKVRFDKDNNIYIIWLEKGKQDASVSMCVSSDGGKSFGDASTVMQGKIDFVDIFFDDDKTCLLYSGENEISLITSADGSQWSAPEPVASFEPYDRVLEKQRVIKSNDEKGIRVNSDPQGIVSNGKLIVTFGAKSSEGDHSEVYVVSGDIKTMEFTESKPIEANSTTDKFLPTISTDGKGGIYILYYSSQNDPGNLMTEAYLATSGDLGNKFTYTNLSTESFDPHDVVVSGSYMGDYISLAVNKDKLIAVWTDGRSGNLDLMAGIVPVKF